MARSVWAQDTSAILLAVQLTAVTEELSVTDDLMERVGESAGSDFKSAFHFISKISCVE